MNAIEFNRLINCIKRDKTAFERLYNFYYPKIVLHIHRVYPNVDAEDIAQEFFVIITKMPRMKWIKRPTSWVYTMCRNIVKKAFRDIKECSIDDNLFEVSWPKSFLDVEENIEIKQQIDDIFLILDNETKQIFILYYWEGYSFKEIAEILNIRAGTIRQKHSRALQKLKMHISRS